MENILLIQIRTNNEKSPLRLVNNISISSNTGKNDHYLWGVQFFSAPIYNEPIYKILREGGYIDVRVIEYCIEEHCNEEYSLYNASIQFLEDKNTVYIRPERLYVRTIYGNLLKKKHGGDEIKKIGKLY